MDIILGADGQAQAVQQAHAAAWERFRGLLQELVSELPALRQPVQAACPLQGRVARRMWQAAHAHRQVYVTPMVAVAGAVAQELIACYERPGIARAWVNNGGDIALHLTPGTSFKVGLYADLDRPARVHGDQGLEVDGVFAIEHASPVRGVATSGWKGRSFSLGLADSVTVLAATAAQADAAASIIGNAVDADAPGIVRLPANQLKDDSDLGDIPVTVEVPPLAQAALQQALQAGWERVLALKAAGLIEACVITCQGWMISCDSAGPGRSGIVYPLPGPRPQAA
jgi:ApbE superfamily uncharacterized protein (UPF0280 family)